MTCKNRQEQQSGVFCIRFWRGQGANKTRGMINTDDCTRSQTRLQGAKEQGGPVQEQGQADGSQCKGCQCLCPVSRVKIGLFAQELVGRNVGRYPNSATVAELKTMPEIASDVVFNGETVSPLEYLPTPRLPPIISRFNFW